LIQRLNRYRDGGWLKFINKEEALRFWEDYYSQFNRGYCYTCGTEDQKPKNEVQLCSEISEKELKELKKYDSNTPWEMRDRD